MGIRGEIFSTKVQLQNRTYFFNVKENRLGDLYLNIVESKNKEEGGFERQSVILFAEDLQEFLKGFDESLKVLEKSAREKRRGRDNMVPRSTQGANDSRGSGERKTEGRKRFKPRDENKKKDDAEGRRHTYKENKNGREKSPDGANSKKRIVVRKK